MSVVSVLSLILPYNQTHDDVQGSFGQHDASASPGTNQEREAYPFDDRLTT